MEAAHIVCWKRNSWILYLFSFTDSKFQTCFPLCLVLWSRLTYLAINGCSVVHWQEAALPPYVCDTTLTESCGSRRCPLMMDPWPGDMSVHSMPLDMFKRQSRNESSPLMLQISRLLPSPTLYGMSLSIISRQLSRTPFETERRERQLALLLSNGSFRWSQSILFLAFRRQMRDCLFWPEKPFTLCVLLTWLTYDQCYLNWNLIETGTIWTSFGL